MKKAGDLFFYVLAYILKWIVVGYAHLFFSIRYAHRNRIPSRGGALVVINHTSFLDFVFAICTVPGLVKFVMNAHTYSRPLMRGLMRRFNFIPVQTAMGQEGRTKFNEAVKAEIEKGHVVVIFAEGTVSRTGQLLEFKKGVEHLSAMLNAPLIPVHFDNLPGSAFTFRAGKNRMERFTLRQWRRRVMIRVGVPVIGKITSFELRERMKELECESFSDRLDRIPGVMRSIEKNLRREPSGEWRSGEQSVSYAEWFASLAAIHSSLAPALQGESSVAVLLPPSADQMLINLYLFSRGFCIVNVDPSWGNEERWHVCRKTGVNTLITSRSYTASKCGPVERQVIYMEDLHQACQQRKPVRGWCKSRSAHMPPCPRTDNGSLPAAVFFDGRGEDLRAVYLTHKNLQAVITGLRQVYYFHQGTCMYAHLDLFHSYGFVLQFLLPLVCDMSLYVAAEGDFTSALAKSEADLVLCTPTQVRQLAETDVRKSFPILRTIFTADIQTNDPAIETLRAAGIQVHTCAGMNRTSSVCCINTDHFTGVDIAGKPLMQPGHESDSIGKPLPGVCLRAFHDDGITMCDAGEVGQLYIKGAAIPEVHDDHWVDTGWKGMVKDNGFVVLR